MPLENCLKKKVAVIKGTNFGTLFTYLKKPFDCLPHNLFLAKLDAYGFNIKALILIQKEIMKKCKCMF